MARAVTSTYLHGTTHAEQQRLTAREFTAGVDALLAWAGRKDASFWYAFCWAQGTRTQTSLHGPRCSRGVAKRRARRICVGWRRLYLAAV